MKPIHHTCTHCGDRLTDRDMQHVPCDVCGAPTWVCDDCVDAAYTDSTTLLCATHHADPNASAFVALVTSQTSDERDRLATLQER